MLQPNAARATAALPARGPRDVGQLGGKTNPTHITKPNIRAMLVGDSRCEALGIVGAGATPVLNLCRQLLAQGVDPDTAVEVYRKGILALRLRSIAEAARLIVKTAGNGTPIFALDASQEGAAALPVCPRSEFDPTEGERLR